ncbi:thioredoxin fold domain-containing protein [Ursidibacter maritimus]|uniref:Thiol:disulfide interchange protein n=2 Tax=Ursidibacter maritimus TaxID=1331689 RepID=A0A949T5M1_9PAST|nr:thioredoxin fold domain-containing protein [Ursidibacter maritimus]KAE9541431.1 hypothetical protein A1D26_00535 [Ursidibacter maritimus]MBV6524903.1 thioredoxin fold domain-containing protein [Ursidibacter maritimus]MBV6526664.1 thioredoxin fold domain-containing protein [Ursidibacter maritimus]MBV6528583.1 thioredoxin fold domain-containing protein [Ursidibacter maritimus]MBV6530463.1 thioredoxin fold domain-containing protein [Ursidibacter maritimus]
MKLSKTFLAIATLFTATTAMASAETSAAQYPELAKSLAVIGITEGYKVEPLDYLNLVKVTTKDGKKLQLTQDGKYAIEGTVYGFKDGAFSNLTQKSALKGLAEIEKTAIVFKATEEKHVVHAFVDITCSFCQKLFKDMAKYNEKGITVKLLAFPREGLDSPTAMRMESIFTAENPAQAYTDAENGKMPENLKEPNIVKQHYKFGDDFGVSGTPFIILANGESIPGYLPPDKLFEAVETITKIKK